MTDLTLTSPMKSSNDAPDPSTQLGWAIAILIFFYALWQALIEAERRYDRAALARVYRKRHQLKRADGPRVLDYPVNDVMRRRAAEASRMGPPAVQPVKPFDAHCQEILQAVVIAFDPRLPVHARRRALKELPCFPQLILALYRGEQEHADALRLKSPHERAEERVASEFCLSTSSVRRRCVQARRATNGLAFDPMTLTVFWEALDQFGREVIAAVVEPTEGEAVVIEGN